MMKQLGWESLAEHRAKAKAAMIYRAVHGLVYIPVWSYLTRLISVTRGNTVKFFIQYCSRTTTMQYFFFPDTDRLRNSLPPDVATAQSYIQDHKLIYEYQFGFRFAFSTDPCLVHLTNYIKQEQDKGNYVGMVLLDLQRAFDTVVHDIIIQKLKALGLDESALNWFLGSHVFSHLCERHIPSAVKCKLLLYADDFALIVPGNNAKEIQLSNELESIREWLIDNKSSLHLGKTE